MKKLLLWILSISSLFAIGVCEARAEETYTPEELLTYWELNGYPDYVGGVYYKDYMSSFVVVLVDATQEEKESLIASINYKKVETAYGKYSHNRLMEINDEIFEMMKATDDIYCMGLDDIGNRIEVGVAEKSLQSYTEYFQSVYGDAVYVEESLPVTSTDDIRENIPAINNNDHYYFLLIIPVTAFVFAVFMRIRRSRTAVYSTAHGTTETRGTAVSKQEIVRRIENSAVTPKDELLTSIKQRISFDCR